MRAQFRDGAVSERLMSLTHTITACTLDCPDACSLIVSQGPSGRIRIRGNPDHPVTQGFACPKMRVHLRRITSPERIVHPLRRTGSTWERISWDAALDLCAERVQSLRHEPSSILYFHGEGSKGALRQAGHLFFGRLGATRVRGSLCDAAGYSACRRDFGSNEGSDIETLMDARSIVNWGRDMLRSSIHMAFQVIRARRRGARVITITPGGDLNARLSDAMIRIRPGTDRFLAAAVIRRIMERGVVPGKVRERTADYDAFARLVMGLDEEALLAACGVPRTQAELIYEAYTAHNPAATIIGAGLQRYAFGGENVRFINALAMVSGNMGIRGGGTFFHLSSLRNFNLAWTRSGVPQDLRAIPMPLIGQGIAQADDPPVRMIFSDGSNMVNQAPGSLQTARAFERVEFTVVVDAFMTDTAARSDLILPCTLMLEQEDVVASYLHDYVHYARPVLAAPGEARSDFSILADLGRRLDPPVLLPDADACMEESLASPYLDVTLEELREKNYARARRPEVAYGGMVFHHEDARYSFPGVLHDEPAPPAGYGLRLLSTLCKKSMHSQILPEDQEAIPTVWVGPDNPALTAMDPLAEVFLVSPAGRMRVRLMTMEGLHPDVVLYRRGDWMRLGGGVNRLVAPRLTDMGSGCAFYDQYVRLENS